MTPSELKTLILAKPNGSPIREAYAVGADATVAELLSKDGVLGDPEPMRISAFATFLAGRGKLRAVCTAQDNAQLPDAVRDVSFLITKLIEGASDRLIEPNDAATVGMMGSLIAAGIVTTDDRDAWREACRRPLTFSADDVTKARNS